MKIRHLIPGFVVAVVLLFSACSHKEEAPDESNKKFSLSDTMMNMITIDSVQYCTMSDELVLSGVVGFNENNVVKIFPSNSGQVMKAPVSLGDHVTKGQVLAVVKSADVAGNYSDLSGADADLAIAKRALDNTESLYKSGISSEREYTEAKQNYEKALAARNKIQTLIQINGGAKPNPQGQYILTSPIDGYLVEKKVAAGSFIRPDMGDNLFSVSDLKTVWVNANIYEADIPRVKEGYSVTVTTLSYPDRVFKGKIDKVSEVLDTASRALTARISLDNSEMLLRPEMYAKVIVDNVLGQKTLCIPSSALIMLNGNQYVVLYNSRADVRNQQVNVLKTVGDKAYISADDNLQPGQKVISKNQLEVFNQLINNQ
jgi:membrane fusion protein, heavy metal efflux system